MKDITTTLFKVPASDAKPTCGTMLVSEPFLAERFFNHGVVSIIDYVASEGATGVVMNNATDYLLRDLIDGISSEISVPVFCGGPVGQDRIFFIHTLGPDVIAGAREYAPGMYVGGDFDAMVDYINAGYPVEGFVRFFIGYCSWNEGQLEKEIAGDTWAVVPATVSPHEILSGSGDSYWHSSVRRLGPRYRS
ncbi:MAG: YqgE/AlgH family protein, partial [Muribaculaceae bacterium]|nr:YqgE/AlgH family protein [Muribaculaceae bacterium]